MSTLNFAVNVDISLPTENGFSLTQYIPKTRFSPEGPPNFLIQ